MAGASFLHNAEVSVKSNNTHVTWLYLMSRSVSVSIFQNSLRIETMQSPQDLIENVRFKRVLENVYVLIRLDLLKDKHKQKNAADFCYNAG